MRALSFEHGSQSRQGTTSKPTTLPVTKYLDAVQSSGLTINISTSKLNIWISHISWRACQPLQAMIIPLFNLFAHDQVSENEAKEPQVLESVKGGSFQGKGLVIPMRAFHVVDCFSYFGGFYFESLIAIE